MKRHSQTRTAQNGFSLFEMLTFVAILGIMTAIAVPVFGSSQGAKQAKDQRNAQSICSLANVATAAGLNLTSGAGIDVTKPMKLLVEGITISSGPLKNRTLRVPNMTAADISGAAQYLEIKDGDIAYSSDIITQ